MSRRRHGYRHFQNIPFSALRRQTWGDLFGRFIQHGREKKGLSIEECAQKAGMEAAAWEAVEIGQVPTTRKQLQAIATGLDMDWTGMVLIATFCRDAWGI